MTDWGEYKGRRRLPCPEDPMLLKGKPIGMYHCPYCGMMVLAGMEHLEPGATQEQKDDPRYPLDDYEDEYQRPWPPGYEMTEEEAEEAVAQIERDLEMNPIASSLPESRARDLYSRIAKICGILDERLEEMMDERRARLDEAAKRKEHE